MKREVNERTSYVWRNQAKKGLHKHALWHTTMRNRDQNIHKHLKSIIFRQTRMYAKKHRKVILASITRIDML